MNMRIIPTLLIFLLLNSCALFNRTPHRITMDTSQHSPVRVYTHQAIQTNDLKRILLLPPMGNISPTMQESLHRQLFSSTQRHFITPVKIVNANSAYAPYIAENNLMAADGTLNLQEIIILGRLMNSSHVMCPYIREIRPYDPQRINLQITFIDVTTAEAPVELSAVFDAREDDIREHFLDFAKIHRKKGELEGDLQLKIHSPATFQAFVTDVCCNILTEKLPF